jgi:large subunit ribosomal protein L23
MSTSTLLVYPRTTEKAYAKSQQNVYVFNVPLDSNKNDIKASVEAQYAVTVTKVKTVIQTGKMVRFSRGKNRYPGKTTRSNTKKAYVTLAEGSSIQVFTEPETPQEAKK